MTKKHALFRMTWKEIREVFAQDPVILIPMGSTEQQGPHAPTGDYRLAEVLAADVAEATGVYYTTTIPFGCSEYFRPFPGTVSFSQDTMLCVIRDVCRSFFEHGATRLIFFCGHAGNGPVLDRAAREFRREKGVLIPTIDLWQQIPLETKTEIFGGQNPSGHGGEPLTSIYSYLFEDEMRMDLFSEEKTNKQVWGFDVKGLTKAALKGTDMEFSLYCNMDDISPEGVMGTPRLANKERGRLLYECVKARCCKIVEAWKQREAVK
jgi:creatinine amidohydrolase